MNEDKGKDVTEEPTEEPTEELTEEPNGYSDIMSAVTEILDSVAGLREDFAHVAETIAGMAVENGAAVTDEGTDEDAPAFEIAEERDYTFDD